MFKRGRNRYVADAAGVGLHPPLALFTSVELSPPRPPQGSISQKVGLRYERRVVEYLEKKGFQVLPQLSFLLFGGSRRRPDILLVDASCYSIVVVEVKNIHTPTACWQLNQYMEIVEASFPWARVAGLEVTKAWYPEYSSSPCFVELESMWNLSRFRHNVLILSDRELRLGLGRTDKDGLRMDPQCVGAPVR